MDISESGLILLIIFELLLSPFAVMGVLILWRAYRARRYRD